MNQYEPRIIVRTITNLSIERRRARLSRRLRAQSARLLLVPACSDRKQLTMRCVLLPAFLVCAKPYSAFASVDDITCEERGVAGIVFGQRINEDQARLIEAVSSGVAYFAIVPPINVSPFTRVTVGVTPRSRQVFSVSLEMQGEGPRLDKVIEGYKAALNEAHPEIVWNTIGNHHYGDRAININVALYRIGDFLDGKATNVLSYDCESQALRSVVFEEIR